MTAMEPAKMPGDSDPAPLELIPRPHVAVLPLGKRTPHTEATRAVSQLLRSLTFELNDEDEIAKRHAAVATWMAVIGKELEASNDVELLIRAWHDSDEEELGYWGAAITGGIILAVAAQKTYVQGRTDEAWVYACAAMERSCAVLSVDIARRYDASQKLPPDSGANGDFGDLCKHLAKKRWAQDPKGQAKGKARIIWETPEWQRQLSVRGAQAKFARLVCDTLGVVDEENVKKWWREWRKEKGR